MEREKKNGKIDNTENTSRENLQKEKNLLRSPFFNILKILKGKKGKANHHFM